MKKVFFVLVVLAGLGVAGVASADHAWGNYHWARTANPFTINLGDNVGAAWDSHLALTANAWSASSVVDMALSSGATNPKNCKAVTGTVQVCNSSYGRNGWLGLAQIWISGSHITKGLAKMNDTYFAMPAYNNADERLHVMCQEVGHTLGLGHTSEDGSSQGTCMDYSSSPQSTLPNAHDYALLEQIYAHFDSFNSFGAASARGASAGSLNPGEWGRAVAQDAQGRDNEFERDLGNGNKVITHVRWAEPRGNHEHHE